MPSNNWGVKNTANNTWLTVYNAEPTLCGWGNEADAVLFSEAFATQEVTDLNTAYQTDSFIGGHPHPH